MEGKPLGEVHKMIANMIPTWYFSKIVLNLHIDCSKLPKVSTLTAAKIYMGLS